MLEVKSYYSINHAHPNLFSRGVKISTAEFEFKHLHTKNN